MSNLTPKQRAEIKRAKGHPLTPTDREALEKRGSNANRRGSAAKVTCPQCGSDQITAQKRGYKVGRSLAASMTVLPVVGLGLGLIGRKKIQVTCINCGNSWMAGKAQ